MKGQAEEYVSSSSAGNKEIATDVDDNTSPAAKRAQTPSKRGMAQERKNEEHLKEKRTENSEEEANFPLGQREQTGPNGYGGDQRRSYE